MFEKFTLRAEEALTVLIEIEGKIHDTNISPEQINSVKTREQQLIWLVDDDYNFEDN
ncbi:MAG: hypothetical protein J7497_14080 [Chitinophagaceae bacterium]|nr:hypothetical protein [Chitinophagaceae bacterium]